MIRGGSIPIITGCNREQKNSNTDTRLSKGINEQKIKMY